MRDAPGEVRERRSREEGTETMTKRAETIGETLRRMKEAEDRRAQGRKAVDGVLDAAKEHLGTGAAGLLSHGMAVVLSLAPAEGVSFEVVEDDGTLGEVKLSQDDARAVAQGMMAEWMFKIGRRALRSAKRKARK